MDLTFDRLMRRRIDLVGSHLCVGIDPRPDRLPAEFRDEDLSEAAAVVAYGRRAIDLVAPHAACIKLQSAFFERLGRDGHDAWNAVATHARDRGLPVIADVKRGDIGPTAEAYAEAGFLRDRQGLVIHALTVNPLFGEDGVRPFVAAARRCGGAIFLLVKTSNPSSREVQDLVVAADGRFVHEHLADMVRRWGEEEDGPGRPSVGAVVGATHGDRLATLREAMPDAWLLVPGVGAQGGSMRDAARGADRERSGILVNVSRGVLEPWSGEAPADWESAVRTAARDFAAELRAALAAS